MHCRVSTRDFTCDSQRRSLYNMHGNMYLWRVQVFEHQAGHDSQARAAIDQPLPQKKRVLEDRNTARGV